jgi:hypothetical protein
MKDTHIPESDRKTYYVAVGAGQILEDPEAASFEFEIRANEEELNKLQEMFEETSSSDEAAVFQFSGLPTVSDAPDNTVFDALIKDIYHLLHQLGTDDTKHHIEAMNILH